MNIDHWPRKREQRNTEQADSRRCGEPSERLKPAGILELGDNLSREASKDDRYGENSTLNTVTGRWSPLNRRNDNSLTSMVRIAIELAAANPASVGAPIATAPGGRGSM